MHAMVEVRFGPLSGKRKVLEPGASIRVGRHPMADICVEQDREMSVYHFQLSWDGSVCRLADLRSTRGTYLNGERKPEAEVPHGGWIKAGTTNFMVYFEDHTAPRYDADVTMTPVKEQALAALEAETDPLFAVLDTTRSDRVLELLRESVEEYRSLYEGAKGDVLAEQAPYLVALPKGTRLLRKLVTEGWGRRWGIYLSSPRRFRDVRQHLRRFLMVREDVTERSMYFRYYDPASLRMFLPVTYASQRASFFGEMSAFLCEDNSGSVIRFQLHSPTNG